MNAEEANQQANIQKELLEKEKKEKRDMEEILTRNYYDDQYALDNDIKTIEESIDKAVKSGKTDCKNTDIHSRSSNFIEYHSKYREPKIVEHFKNLGFKVKTKYGSVDDYDAGDWTEPGYSYFCIELDWGS